MLDARLLLVLGLFGCKGSEPEHQAATPPPTPPQVAPIDSAPVDAAPTWYRVALLGENKVEAVFFLGVPAPRVAGDAIIRVGRHELRFPATFDGNALAIPMTVQQTAIKASVGPDGKLSGTLSGTWRVIGDWSLPLTGTKVAAPSPSALATVAGDEPVTDLREPRTVWKVTLKESGIAKLVLTQMAPGEYEALLFFDTGNIVSLAGNGRGDALVLCGSDGFSSYRLELTLDKPRKHARGSFGLVSKTDKPETLGATRSGEFAFALKPRLEKPGVKIVLPDVPAITSLPEGPLVVELAGSWCPTCRLAAPLLRDLYKDYQPKGLQMVTLLYELTDDPKQDAEQAARFKKTYEVPWAVVPVPGGAERFAEIVPHGVVDVDPQGFPVILFIAADHTIIAVHAGFPPPDSDELPRVAAELRGSIEKLLVKPK